MVSFDKLIEKIKEVSNAKTIEEVAEIIDVKANTLRKKNINSIPYHKLVKFTEEYKIDLNWILNDVGEKFLNENKSVEISEDEKLKEVIRIYKKLPLKEQNKIYHKLKYEELEMED